MSISIHIDGEIFKRQRFGGISRCFSNILQAMQHDDSLKLHLHLPDGALPPVQLTDRVQSVAYSTGNTGGRLRRRLQPQQDGRERHWQQYRDGLYQATYYTTWPGVRIPQVQIIQDMIYEEHPDCFRIDDASQSRLVQGHIDEKRDCVVASAAVVCPSEVSLQHVNKHYPMGDRPTTVIPYALDPGIKRVTDEQQLQQFKQQHTAGRPFILVSGARYAHKNFLCLLNAYALWPGRKDYQLLAVGGHPATEWERRTIYCLGLEAHVHFLAEVDDQVLSTAYSACAAMVMPSISEGYGFPLLEAMACGAPILSSDGGSLPEVGQDTVKYYPAREPAALLAGLDEVVNEPLNEAAMALAAQRSWEDVAQELAAFYKQLL